MFKIQPTLDKTRRSAKPSIAGTERFDGKEPHRRKFHDVYNELNAMVFEYFELNGLERSIAAFSTECKAKNLPCPSRPSSGELKAAFSAYDADRILKFFDEGDLDGFLKVWKLFQLHIQVTSDDMKKLEIYLRVHFALWPRAHDEPEHIQIQSMNTLKSFFEEHCSSLSNDAAVLPLFALPFVQDPVSHPIFRDLFQPSWTRKLRQQLESTLDRYFELLQENIGDHCKLASVILEHNSSAQLSPQEKFERTEERFFQLVSTYRKTRKLLKGTRESYGKLLQVALELINALEMKVEEKSLSIENTLQKCFHIFPEIFTPDTSLDTDVPNMNYFKSLAATAMFDSMLDSDVSLFFLGISDLTPDCLNYDAIKDTLTCESVNQSDKLCLLQALRWLITKANATCRKLTLTAFVENDILGLFNPDPDLREKIFQCMFSPVPTYQKECFSRFLNAFASCTQGRSYMSMTSFVIDVMIKSLPSFKTSSESFICQMVVATLQKLSLRKSMRLVMIKSDVIPWLISYIKKELVLDDDSVGEPKIKLNPYLMEYGWALLMNLCLHEESRDPSFIMGPDILTCVIRMLMSQPNKDISPYVISTLYSILRNPEVFKMAKRMNLHERFSPLLKDDSEIKTHLSQVLAVLHSDDCDRVTAMGEIDYDDDDNPDPDEFEPEIELLESWVEALDEKCLVADDLLLRKYISIKRPDAIVPTQSEKKEGLQTTENLFLRPVTPNNLSSTQFESKKSYAKKASIASDKDDFSDYGEITVKKTKKQAQNGLGKHSSKAVSNPMPTTPVNAVADPIETITNDTERPPGFLNPKEPSKPKHKKKQHNAKSGNLKNDANNNSSNTAQQGVENGKSNGGNTKKQANRHLKTRIQRKGMPQTKNFLPPTATTTTTTHTG